MLLHIFLFLIKINTLDNKYGDKTKTQEIELLTLMNRLFPITLNREKQKEMISIRQFWKSQKEEENNALKIVQ